ncbi:MAG: hypothetical protein ACI9F9_000259 [Candidatus Paceibacteria bacterium]|jgi:hypothetical protein
MGTFISKHSLQSAQITTDAPLEQGLSRYLTTGEILRGALSRQGWMDAWSVRDSGRLVA